MAEKLSDRLKYNADGLVTVVTQDAANDQVLMVAHMNDKALRKTIATSFESFDGWLAWKTYSSKISVNKKYGSWSNDANSVTPPADTTVKQ